MRSSSSRSADGLRRSVRLFRAFREEQSDPRGFYGLIADDAVRQVARHALVRGRLVADFGGGPGFYTRAFRAAGARTVLVDADPVELTLDGPADRSAVVGRVEQSPLADRSVDIAFSSNMLEHVPDFASACDAMARVVRPGGLLVLSFTVWFGPWGGHETSPWHYFGGNRAARRYARTHGVPPKNLFGSTMYAAHVRDGLRWSAQARDFEVLELRPRYLPPWAAVVLRLPLLREVLTWNLWMVLRRTG
ncbi:class I SAM-dependent methyltransferase [Nocardioides mesophilus]|uniref:Class I SAM-dependent methyltransferase n=1 Tax=Nocardioides mesophilus TaxID=433659 RepID=A0A7G9RBQ8_9ACTN|nr:class I SAM-dependent methyltransferase [Nocardioides mesophilus]QNN53033.1 class I SAM-dependent methyltransferase [Nocardioides mesophilus]